MTHSSSVRVCFCVCVWGGYYVISPTRPPVTWRKPDLGCFSFLHSSFPSLSPSSLINYAGARTARRQRQPDEVVFHTHLVWAWAQLPFRSVPPSFFVIKKIILKRSNFFGGWIMWGKSEKPTVVFTAGERPNYPRTHRHSQTHSLSTWHTPNIHHSNSFSLLLSQSGTKRKKCLLQGLHRSSGSSNTNAS